MNSYCAHFPFSSPLWPTTHRRYEQLLPWQHGDDLKGGGCDQRGNRFKVSPWEWFQFKKSSFSVCCEPHNRTEINKYLVKLEKIAIKSINPVCTEIIYHYFLLYVTTRSSVPNGVFEIMVCISCWCWQRDGAGGHFFWNEVAKISYK